MGSSNRTDLKQGRVPQWEHELRLAISHIESVAAAAWNSAGDDGQYDNAADDGALCENLYSAAQLLRSELPKTREEKLERIQQIEAELKHLRESL